MHEVCTGLTTKGQPRREFPARLSFCDSVSVGRVVCLCLGVLALFQNFNCAGDGPGDGHAHKPRVLRDRKQLVRAKGNACERLYWYTTGRFFPIGWGPQRTKSKTKTYLFFRYRRNKAFYCTSQLRMPNDKMDRRGISLGDHCPAPLMDQDL